MQQQLDQFLSKKPGPRSLLIVALILALLLLCCLCLVTVAANAPTRPTVTLTTSPLPDTLTFTITPSLTLTPSITPSITLSPTPSITFTPTLSPTASLTFTPTLTQTPTSTPTSTITPTPNPMVGPERLAVYQRTGNVWVTNPDIDQLYELDGTDLHVVSHIQVSSPNGIDIWQRRGLAYVTNRLQNTVTEVDLNAKRVIRTIPVGKSPEGVAVYENTGDVFVADNQSNDIACISASLNQVYYVSSDSTYNPFNGPTQIIEGYPSYTDTGPSTPGATFVDSKGTVETVLLDGDYCGFQNANHTQFVINDFLAGIAFGPKFDTYFLSDLTNPKMIMMQRDSHVSAGLPHVPVAISNLNRCIGAVVPDENRLYLLSYDNKSILKTIAVGSQGPQPGGGQGLAYNPNNDTAYVANRADNTVTRISHPCP